MTLAERIEEAISESGVTVAQVAEACGISPQAVYGWMKGETRELMAENAVELAELTGYEAKWLVKEKGPKRRTYAKTPQQAHVLQAMEGMSPYQANMLAKIATTITEPPSGSNGNLPRAA